MTDSSSHRHSICGTGNVGAQAVHHCVFALIGVCGRKQFGGGAWLGAHDIAGVGVMSL